MSNGIGLTDVAASKDLFEIGPYIKGLSDFIKECKTPMTISIQGTWGTGKTSIMNMVEAELNQNPMNYHCVEFNTWEFSQFDLEKKLSIVMIQSLIESLSDNNAESIESIKSILKFAASLGAGFLSNGATADLDKVLEKGYLTQLRELKQEFQLLVNKKAGIIPYKSKLDKKNQKENEKLLEKTDGNKRVIFFIDDLDRLNPGRAVELLEVLKNFLDCKNCVFVLAIDYDVVWRGVAAKYGDVVGDTRAEISKKGKDFFDKIIQVPFKMPVASYKVDEYIKNCLEEIEVPTYGEVDTYVSLVQKSVGTNPRSLKRIINSLALLIKVIGSKRLDEIRGYKLLFAVLCMQHAYEDLYNYLVSNRDEVTYSLLDSITKASGTDLEKQLEDVDMSEIDIDSLQAFMQVFVCKAMDLNNSGKIEQADSYNETEILKEILAMSSITSGNADTAIEKKKMAELADRNTMKHVHFSEEQVSHVLGIIEQLIPGDPKVSRKYVNTKGYGHVEYRIEKVKFIDVIFYDDDRGWIEVGCIPTDKALWDRPELSEICVRRKIMKGISYFAAKGISYKYRFDPEDKTLDEDLKAVISACYDDVVSKNR